jgi:dTDP-L-rhamnose 4-epimerase
MHVAVIGGAGFIGGHVVDALVARNYKVRIIDSLDAQVHPTGLPPAYLNKDAEFIRQDIREIDGLRKSLEGVEAVFHFAGAVGVGDSMYRIRHYAEANVLGGANLLDILANHKHSVRKIVLASSVTVYGEGRYSCPRHGSVSPPLRTLKELGERKWELHCAISQGNGICGEQLTPMATDETKPVSPQSIYAVTKRAQEEMFLTAGRTYNIPVTVLRYFNVYGSRQALSNPYTGVAKVFALDLSQGKTPVIYEDGMQTRDFVHVSDIVEANILALAKDEANYEIFNVGTGRPVTILDMAKAVATTYGNSTASEPLYRYRAGDVRHCWADTTKIRKMMGFTPRTIFPAGIEELLGDADGKATLNVNGVEQKGLVQRGLIV